MNKRNVIICVSAFAGLLLAANLIYTGILRKSNRPNIIVIVVDSLRSDHVGCYGYERQTTPNIDLFAKDAVLFQNAVASAPWTSPSTASLLTSQYPSTLGIYDKPVAMYPEFPILTEMLKEDGYATCGVISSVTLTSKMGFGRGFDRYAEVTQFRHDGASSPAVTGAAISFLRENDKEPFFLFVHYFDPHYDYLFHPRYDFYPGYDGNLKSGEPISVLWSKRHNMTEDDVRYLNALYDSEIAFTDSYIGLLLKELKRLNLYDDSLILFTSDHGEEFMERGWIGHSITLYQELIHVPMLLRLPQGGSHTVETSVGQIDFMPTILDYLGIEIPAGAEGRPWDLDAPERIKERPIFSETFNPQSRRVEQLAPIALRSVISGGHKLILDQINNTMQIYDITKDRDERMNLALDSAGRYSGLERIMHTWLETMMPKEKSDGETDHSELFTEEQLEQLEALGYL